MRWSWWKKSDQPKLPESWRVVVTFPDGSTVVKGSNLSRADAQAMYRELAATDLTFTLERDDLIQRDAP
jgi:hypothetical protein